MNTKKTDSEKGQALRHDSGQAMMIATILFMVVSITIIFGLVGPALRQYASASNLVLSRQSYFLAEAGVEDVVYRLKNGLSVSSTEILNLDGNTATTVITDTSDGKKVITVGEAGETVRKVETNLLLGVGIAFHYGVQVGQGGLEMSNFSKIIGNVYSNGNIIGTNSARIEGTAIASGPAGIIDGTDIDGDSWSHTISGNSTVGGNASHAVFQNTTVSGNVAADSISNCTIGGTAKYDTRSSCVVNGGITTPNPDDFVPAAILPMPISEEQIDAWEQEAEAGGVVGDQAYSSGTISLGPKKIDGDLILDNTAELIVTGTLWVTGDIKLSNSAILRLDQSYGNSSGVVMAGIDESLSTGYIEISNSAQALGSGSLTSYILLLSQREAGSTAIKTSNNSGAAILYAGEGEIEINNSAALKEVTAHKLKITNSATVTYESGLANSNFSAGPGGGYDILSWEEIE
ncbi:MAG: hypothetical protein CO183_02620 [Candidatus Zambryskibacteria bacterium CG_4_9_14_3_um_filter_42_9]|nr:MAG: hypothetical protein CO183_02620 [Candidatus Zambryskibacteria bacterium CG_4_9_14_3_um_filter_42_9]